LSGATCSKAVTSTVAASVESYSCAPGFTLNGTACTKQDVQQAAVSYKCPDGATLSGTTCTTVVTTPATVNYSCPDGSAPIGSTCMVKTAQTAWNGNCAALAASAGVVLKH